MINYKNLTLIELSNGTNCIKIGFKQYNPESFTANSKHWFNLRQRHDWVIRIVSHKAESIQKFIGFVRCIELQILEGTLYIAGDWTHEVLLKLTRNDAGEITGLIFMEQKKSIVKC